MPFEPLHAYVKSQLSLCGSRKCLYPHYTGSLEILRGRGVSKAKSFKGKYQPKLEFLDGCGIQTPKTLCGAGVWIFSQHISTIKNSRLLLSHSSLRVTAKHACILNPTSFNNALTFQRILTLKNFLMRSIFLFCFSFPHFTTI